MNKEKFINLLLHIIGIIFILGGAFFILMKFSVISLESSQLPLVITLNHNRIGLKELNTYQLHATVYPKNVDYGIIKWSSSDEDIVSISSNGKIKAHKTGLAIIKATTEFNNLEAECIVSVTKDNLLVKNIYVDSEEINLSKGDTYNLSYSLTPSNANVLDFEYISSDTTIAVVNSQGMIKALSPGRAIVTVKSSVNNVSDNILINVYDNINDNEKEMFLFEKDELEIGLGESIKVQGNIDTSSEQINWFSTNKEVAVVSNDGIVTSVNEGITTIYAITLDGAVSLCKIRVINNDSSKYINIIDEDIEIEVGSSKKINYNFLLKIKDALSIKWLTSNSNIVLVDSGIITAINEGTAVINISAGDYSDQIRVKVVNPKNSIKLNKITFSKDYDEVNINDTVNLIPILFPNNASKYLTTWHSSNKDLAIVEDGFVKFLKKGEVVISVNCSNTKASIKFKINEVLPSVVTFKDDEVSLKVGDSKYLIKQIIPSNVTNPKVEWKSSDNSIVSVSEDGLIKGLKKGNATITIKTFNEKSANIKVKVW